MIKRMICLGVMISIIAICSVGRAEAYKPRVAVYSFESKASSGFWHSAKWDIGTGMGEMLVDALVNTGKFEVIERLDLEDITSEQDLVTAGRVSQKTGAKTGEIKGAEYIVRGTITEFDVRDSGGDLGLTIKGFRVGGRMRTAHIGGIIRIYDATTGTIYDSKRFEKKVPATGVSFGHTGGDVGISLGAFKETPLGKATHVAIADMVGFISTSIPLEPRISEITCEKCGATVASTEQYCPKCGANLSVRTPDACPNCGQAIAPGTKFCPNCGTQISGLSCPNCQKQLPAGTKFCPYCGTEVKNQ